MKRKFFTFLMAFLATVGNAVWGQDYKATIDLSNPQDGDGVDWMWNNPGAEGISKFKCFRITENGTYLVTGSSDVNYIEVGHNILNKVTDVTLILDNVTMTSSGNNDRGPIWIYDTGSNGTEPIVKIQLKGENHITNSSGSGAAINVNNNANLIIEDADNLDGILYVEGNVGIGNPDGGIGDIQINGGTVVASGYPGIGGTDLDNITKFTLNGNAFVVANGLKVTPNLTKGIFCDNSNGNTIATVYGDVILNSTYPDDENYQLKIDQNATLTLGEGYTLPKDRMVNITSDKDRFKAFEVEWLANAIAGDEPTATLPNLYYGTNINVTEGVSYTCNNNLHSPIGWLKDDATSVVTSVSTDNSAPTSFKSIRVGCAWIDAKRTINGTTKKPLTDATLRVYPTTVTNVSFKADDANLPTGISLGQDGKTLSGTATNEGTTEVLLSVYIDGSTAVGENIGTTVTFNIQEETDYVIDTKNTNNKVSGSATYSGQAIEHSTFEDQFISLYFTDDKGKRAEATNIYFDIVSCTYAPFTDDNGTLGSEQTGITEIKETGVYKNFIIKAADDQDVSLSEGSEYTITSGQFTINKATVTVTPTGELSANESETESLPTIQYSSTSTVDSKLETPAFDGDLALEAIDGSPITDLTKPGTYKIVQGTLKLKESGSFKPSNYTLKVAEGSTFIIKDDISNNANVTVTVSGADDLIYKGTAYTPADYVTVDGLDEGTYRVRVKTDGTFAYLRNAGTYTVVISGIGDAAFGDKETDATITIKQAPIKAIKANDQTITIGEVVKTDATINPEIITIDGLVNNEQAVITAGIVSVDTNIDTNIAGQYTDALSITSLTIGEQSEGFLKANYSGWDNFTTSNYGKGTLTVTDDSGIDIELPEEGSVLVDDGDGTYSLVYDGKAHTDLFDNTTITIKVGEQEPVVLTTDDYKVSFSKVGDDSFQEVTSPWNVGTYHATITVTKDEEDYKDKSTIVVFDITPRLLNIIINDQTIEANGSVNKNITDGTTITINNKVDGETPAFTDDATLTCDGTFEAGHIYTDAISWTKSITLKDNNNFKATNYQLPSEIAAADLTVKQTTDSGSQTDPIDPTDDKSVIELAGDWKDGVITYDGNEHPVKGLRVKFTDSKTGAVTYKDVTVSTVTYTPSGTPMDAKDYIAAITLPDDAPITVTGGGKIIYVKLSITPKDMSLDLHLPTSKDEVGDWNPAKAFEYDGLVTNCKTNVEETPSIKSDVDLVVVNGKAVLTGKPFIEDNATTGFKYNNYTVKYLNNGMDITEEIEDGTDDKGNVTLPDDLFPDSGSGDGSDDDNNDPNHGGNPGDINRPAKYYNIYVDTAATCDGVELSFSKNVVREGNQVSVYVDKILEGYNADDMKLWFKRSLYGYWEELEEGVQPGEYIIYNVYTDIYVKATNVEKNPTGIEEIEGVKVYAQDGSLYVYTPKQMPIWIVSMTGAIVRHEEQIGLHQYDHLNQGIYIVRVGEQVFKIRL